MILRKYSEIIKEKKEIAKEKLKEEKPAILASLKEGILLSAINPGLKHRVKFRKIYPLHDRIACIISGSRCDFKEVFTTLRLATENWAGFYSEDDIIVEELAEALAYYLKERFENLRRATPYIINVVIAEINSAKQDDIFIQIDFSGALRGLDPCSVIGDESEKSETMKKIKKILKDNNSIEEVLSEIAKEDKALRRANEGCLETVFLSREKVIKKEFDSVFQRIDFKDLNSKANSKDSK